jgi:formylglycine-generating enzyme required for sulfatase activity
MAGNVWEWTSTIYEDYPYDASDGREDLSRTDGYRVLRSGSFEGVVSGRSATRSIFQPAVTSHLYSIGFRCTQDYTAASPTTSGTQPTPAPDSFALAETGVTANAEWEPVVQEFDAVEMVLVPAGCFMMGTESGTPEERPVHEVCFDEPFWLDRHEETQGDFARLGGTQARSSDFTGTDRPVEQITWFEARDFCALRGGRLPTEAEWEYAARGPDSLLYPWGNDFEEGNLVFSGNIDGQTAPVSSRPQGASWVGANDMTGNLWEWTSTVMEPYPYVKDDGRESPSNTANDRVMRGGSWWETDLGYFRATYRGTWHPEGSINFGGFRCARDF